MHYGNMKSSSHLNKKMHFNFNVKFIIDQSDIYYKKHHVNSNLKWQYYKMDTYMDKKLLQFRNWHNQLSQDQLPIDIVVIHSLIQYRQLCLAKWHLHRTHRKMNVYVLHLYMYICIIYTMH